MATTKRLDVVIAGQATGAKAAFAETAVGADALAMKMNALGTKMAAFGQKMTIGATLPILAVGAASFKFASDLQESLTKTDVIFKNSGNGVKKWSQTSARAMGLSRSEALEGAANFGNMFNTIGLGTKESAKMSKSMTQLAADMGSLNNEDPSEMLDRLRSGLAGEAEPLRRFGVLLSEAEVKAFAYRNGIAKVGVELTEAQKVQARYGLILEQTKTAQGDFARTADGAANQQRILMARLKDTAATIGETLLPVGTKLIGVLSGMAQGFTSLPAGAREAVVGFAAVVAAIGPISWIAGTAMKSVSTLMGVFQTLSSAAQSGALRVLYMAEALKALSASQLLVGGGIGLLVAGLAALWIKFQSGASSIERAREAGERWGQAAVRDSKFTTNAYESLIRTNRELETRIKAVKAEREKLHAQQQSDNTVTSEETMANVALQGVLAELEGRHKSLGPEIARLRGEHEAAKAAESRRRASVQELADGTTNFATATEDGIKAVQDFQSTLLAAAGGELGFQQSTINQQKAQEELNVAIRDFGPASVEARDARLNLAQADLTLANSGISLFDTQADLEKQYRDNPALIDAQIRKLEDVKAKYPEATAAIQPHIDKLNWLKLTLGSIPPTLATHVTVVVDTAAFDNALRRIREVDTALSSGNRNFSAPVSGSSGLRRFAHGGRPPMGVPSIVGERGPELFVPDVAGRVIPNGKFGSSGGGSTNLTVIVQSGEVISEAGFVEMVRSGMIKAARTTPGTYLPVSTG